MHELRMGKTGTYVQTPPALEIPLEEVLPYQALRCKQRYTSVLPKISVQTGRPIGMSNKVEHEMIP